MKKIVIVLGFFGTVFASCNTLKETQTTTPRKDVDAAKGNLTLHPVFTDLLTKNEQFFFFLDSREKTLFMTNDSTMFISFSNYLPEVIVPGRSILLEGSFIDPFTVFTKEEFDELNTKMAKLGVELNGYKVARIFNYGFMSSASYPLPGVQMIQPAKQGKIEWKPKQFSKNDY